MAAGLAVFDIDGVVADVRHRLHHLAGRPKDWDGFFDAAADDPPLPTGIALVAELAQRHEIVWLTGRRPGCDASPPTGSSRTVCPATSCTCGRTTTTGRPPLQARACLQNLAPRGDRRVHRR